jgi:hypothetical protein
LPGGWSYLPDISVAIIEWLCGEPLTFEQRFAITAWDEMSPWSIGVSRVPMGTPIILTVGSTRRIDFRTFVEVGSTCEEGGIHVWVNQVSQGEIKSTSFCVSKDEYLFILPASAYNPDTGAYWLPEDPLVFAIR